MKYFLSKRKLKYCMEKLKHLVIAVADKLGWPVFTI